MAKANGHSADGNKARSLELAMSQIEKQYGKGSIMRLGDEGWVQEVEAILQWIAGCRCSAGHRWLAQGEDRRDIGYRGGGQDHALSARHPRVAKAERHGSLYRRRTRP